MWRHERRYYGYRSDRLIVIQRSKVRVFAGGFAAGIGAAMSLVGLLQLCWCL